MDQATIRTQLEQYMAQNGVLTIDELPDKMRALFPEGLSGDTRIDKYQEEGRSFNCIKLPKKPHRRSTEGDED